jgi:hypothetical protein
VPPLDQPWRPRIAESIVFAPPGESRLLVVPLAAQRAEAGAIHADDHVSDTTVRRQTVTAKRSGVVEYDVFCSPEQVLALKMTNPKTAPRPMPADGAPRVEHPQPLVKTQEMPAIDAISSDGEPNGRDQEPVPCEIVDGDITVPMRSSIESTLTFEVLRRQSIKTDDD